MQQQQPRHRAPQDKQPIVFCDFDGTITLSDNIVAIMKHFDPPGWNGIVQDIISGAKSIRQGVGELFALLPSSRKQEVEDYVLQSAGIRPGFADLLALCKRKNIPFYVTSGGIDFFLRPLLAPYDIEESHIYCNSADFSKPHIEIVWPHPCDDECRNDCGMCKTRVIRRFPKERYYRMLIGDSVTDFEGAKLADLVFARSHLATRCKELGLPHYEYDTFFDVIEVLEEIIEGATPT
ncbi:2-hydroxy-3-keto-5-methylthiopentenyl-1-phosphate phosphatase [Paenibacillus sp.]|uniref:2-hydroxy-3-keto-5-methylthiopentenyl-1- phosphate phosphatase n=1 Tax=Paenibacillus sp. TaxID=58172 RepID=UPI002D3A569E|nr:2-hydroxy-3-keto-5-methylthiopentenyl-1-phosphate phosphatase [Paenibacillus sp.]HZG55074.1 2-hydroxy-3-keto-5-methylthiopentenyl-1-phosphate phosphatase [Paenibacillus sp.]